MPWMYIVIGYLLGSIPTAYIAGRLLKGRDIRHIGDGNMGAQNAFRQIGARIGITVGIIDAAKGAIAVLLAQSANLSQLSVLAVGVAAVAGHNWPLFLRFRGGKGASTAIGVLAVVVTVPVLIVAMPTILVLYRWHNVDYACATFYIPVPFLSWLFGYSPLLIGYSIGLPCLVALTHLLWTRWLPAPQRIHSDR